MNRWERIDAKLTPREWRLLGIGTMIEANMALGIYWLGVAIGVVPR